MSRFNIGDKVILVEDDFECSLVGSFGPANFQYQLGQIYEVVDEFEITDGYWIEQGKVSFSGLKELEHCFAKTDFAYEQVNSPKHYNVLEDIEAIQIIASSMTYDMFKGYCLGNILKYRLRCGAKDDVTQELAKADKYKELFAKYKHMCKGEK